MNPRYEIIRFPDPIAMAQSAVRDWVKDVAQHDPAHGPYSCALSGGRIAKLFLSIAAAAPDADREGWSKVDFFWADERCVDPSDPESNYRMANDCFLRPVGISANRIHRIQGELGGVEAACHACKELLRVLNVRDGTVPILSVLYLGMGEDGHVASLFPGPAEEVSSMAPYISVIGPKPPPQRVTMSLAVMQAARKVVVMISGPGKAEVLLQVASGKSELPIAKLLQGRSDTKVWVDSTVFEGGMSWKGRPS